jgi:hypothetical protein
MINISDICRLVDEGNGFLLLSDSSLLVLSSRLHALRDDFLKKVTTSCLTSDFILVSNLNGSKSVKPIDLSLEQDLDIIIRNFNKGVSIATLGDFVNLDKVNSLNINETSNDPYEENLVGNIITVTMQRVYNNGDRLVFGDTTGRISIQGDDGIVVHVLGSVMLKSGYDVEDTYVDNGVYIGKLYKANKFLEKNMKKYKKN